MAGKSAAKRATKPRKEPAQERSQATVRAILDATARVLVKEGYEGASTNRIAAAAGVSVGSLYQYFPNKQSLVAALLAEHRQRMTALFESHAFELRDVPITEAAPIFVRALFHAHHLDPRLHRVLVEQIPHVGTRADREALETRAQDLLLLYLQQHLDEIRPMNLQLGTYIAVQAMEAIAHETVLRHPEYLGTEELINEAAALLAGYFLKK